MFTGIIEQTGTVTACYQNASNLDCWIQANFTPELQIDQSIAHNGICLTVVEIAEDKRSYRVTAIQETIQKTNLISWRPGTVVNLERCLQINARLDGHIVQGHVDTVGIALQIQEQHGSWIYRFSYPSEHKQLIVPKGSICVNGVSLTVVDVVESEFSVAIIPYTYQHTNFRELSVGDIVNLEFDIIGKYVQRWLQFRSE
ncbi:MAG: riboflavin synthase [Bacteroidia bacterium]|nr:riboflavin synthase [Bacteroidia bacterium]